MMHGQKIIKVRDLVRRKAGDPESLLLEERKWQLLCWKYSTKNRVSFLII
jgi:hypothetical protein